MRWNGTRRGARRLTQPSRRVGLRLGPIPGEGPTDECVRVTMPHAILRLEVAHDCHVLIETAVQDDLLPLRDWTLLFLLDRREIRRRTVCRPRWRNFGHSLISLPQCRHSPATLLRRIPLCHLHRPRIRGRDNSRFRREDYRLQQRILHDPTILERIDSDPYRKRRTEGTHHGHTTFGYGGIGRLGTRSRVYGPQSPSGQYR